MYSCIYILLWRQLVVSGCIGCITYNDYAGLLPRSRLHMPSSSQRGDMKMYTFHRVATGTQLRTLQILNCQLCTQMSTCIPSMNKKSTKVINLRQQSTINFVRLLKEKYLNLAIVKNYSSIDYGNYMNSTVVTESTIFSLSSGHGKCGVAMVRVSGPSAIQALTQIAQFQHVPASREATLRRLVDPETGVIIDRGIVILFPGPQSFTGEDCVEFQVHGGPAVVSALLTALHQIPGCRQAEPGEFTKRAFMNGKMDLTEVEGLGDLIHAETEAQRRQALRQMEGDLSKLYSKWRKAFIKCVADLEAFIDFGEDQHIEESVLEQVTERVVSLKQDIVEHLNDKRHGERLREGVHVVIIGEPNVGKSSLLNSICQRPAAIVTEIAGTTRDIIEMNVNIGGYPVLLSDTAGLRETQDIVEREGVLRAVTRAREADIRVLVFDLTNQDFTTCTNTESFLSHHLTDLGLSSHSLHHGNGLNKNMRKYSEESKLSADVKENLKQDDVDFSETIVVFNKVDLVDISNEIKLKNSTLDAAINTADLKSTNTTNRNKFGDNVNASSVNDNNFINNHAEHLPLCGTSSHCDAIVECGETVCDSERLPLCDTSSHGEANVEFDETVCDDTNQDSDMVGQSLSEDLARHSRQPGRKKEYTRYPVLKQVDVTKETDYCDRPSAVCHISCVTGEGMDRFLEILESKVAHLCGNPLSGSPSLTQARHRSHLFKCLEHLERFSDMTDQGDVVLASEALRRALREIGKITGKVSAEEILDVIFKDFCIGK